MISLVLVSVHVLVCIMEIEGGTAGFGSPSVAGQSRARGGWWAQMKGALESVMCKAGSERPLGDERRRQHSAW